MQYSALVLAGALAVASANYSNSSYVPAIVISETTDIVIGEEICIIINISEVTNVYVGNSTVTAYVTSTATSARPIYKSKDGYPCYSSAMEEEGYECPSSSYIYATTTICDSIPPSYPTHSTTSYVPIIKTCPVCEHITLTSTVECDTDLYSTTYLSPTTEDCTITAPYTVTATATITHSHSVVPTQRTSMIEYTHSPMMTMTPPVYTGAAVAVGNGAAAGAGAGAFILVAAAALL